MKRTLLALAAIALAAAVSASTLPATTPSSSQSTFTTFKLTAAPAATLPAENYVAVKNVLAGVMQKAKWFEPADKKAPLYAKSPAAPTDVITAVSGNDATYPQSSTDKDSSNVVLKAGQFQPGGKYVEGALTAVAIWGASTNSAMIGAS